MKLSRFEIMANMGFETDPFEDMRFETSDQARIRKILKIAAPSGAMINIVGDRGMGKTLAVNAALRDMRLRVVRVQCSEKTRLGIGDIEQAMILDMSEETPKRTREVRARQLRRILGEASQRHTVVVVIEEGHRIHGNTLRSLKTLREIEWMGKSKLFSVVILGQSNPMSKPGVAEVRLRSDVVNMTGLTGTESEKYIRDTVGRVFEDAAISLACSMSEARNFLDLQEALLDAMGAALASGRATVTAADIRKIWDQRDAAIPCIPEIRRGNSVIKNLIRRKEEGSGRMSEERQAASAGY